MHYYKIISNGTVIDVNDIFLKWQSKHRILIGCDAEHAHFIQSSDQQHVWHVSWLNPLPADVGEFETIEAVEISEEEYNELKSQLDSGETLKYDIEDEAIEVEPPIFEEEPESIMTVEEMRRRIIELESVVDSLLKTSTTL